MNTRILMGWQALAIAPLLFITTGCGDSVEVGAMLTESQSVGLEDAESVRVKIEMGAGDLAVAGGSDKLLDADFTYNVADLRPEVVYDVSGDRGTLTIQQPDAKGLTSFQGLSDYRYEWDLRLSDAVPMDLSVNIGAGSSELQLSGLSLTALDVNTGAGETTVDLTGDWDRDLDVNIEGGVGEITVRLPGNIGVSVEADLGIGSVDAPDMTKDGDTYTNGAYGQSDVTLTVEIDGGVGEITLEVEPATVSDAQGDNGTGELSDADAAGQLQAAHTPPITDAEGDEIPGSIAAIETVTLGGVEQTITLRGEDTTKPVLLFLHGGPGMPSSPWVTWNSFQADLEAEFVVVHWDQRGAGNSYSEALTSEDMQVEDFVSDTMALTDILRERFEQDKIFLWGHSWGSALGFETLRVSAEPYHAYIASGVRPDWNSTQTMGYEWALEQARLEDNAEAIQALESVESFDPTDLEHHGIRGQYLSLYRGGDFHTEGLEDAWLNYVLSGQSPEYPASAVEKTLAGLDLTRGTTLIEIKQSGYDLFTDFPVSPIPVYFLAGRYDYETPGELAEAYYDALEAPAKSFTWFENSAHNVMYDESDKTNQELIRIATEILNP